MPKNTFFNLPVEKREKIIKCAKDEFSKYSFYDASINRIIKEAGVSRGSFYQYFENKEDLFIYLLDELKDKILKAMRSNINSERYDFFEIQLLIFDYITNEAMESEDREFIISFISNLDIKFGQYLMKFIDDNKFLDKFEFCTTFNNKENIRISTKSEFIALHSIFTTTLTNQLAAYFLNAKDLEECRKELITISDIIKYGIIK